MKAMVDIYVKITLQSKDNVEKILMEVPYQTIVDKVKRGDKDAHIVFAEHSGYFIIPIENGDLLRVYVN